MHAPPQTLNLEPSCRTGPPFGPLPGVGGHGLHDLLWRGALVDNVEQPVIVAPHRWVGLHHGVQHGPLTIDAREDGLAHTERSETQSLETMSNPTQQRSKQYEAQSRVKTRRLKNASRTGPSGTCRCRQRAP